MKDLAKKEVRAKVEGWNWRPRPARDTDNILCGFLRGKDGRTGVRTKVGCIELLQASKIGRAGARVVGIPWTDEE